MTLILDAGPLIALADLRDSRWRSVQDQLDREQGDLVLSAVVSAEVDYLLGVRHGRSARLSFLADLAAGTFTIESMTRSEHALALDLERRYADLDLGLADASTIVLAARFDTRRILTFDHRHFRSVSPLQGGSFEVLPA
ncbi:MAG: PIN domain-containing protein [Sporichthyaceae bacterium]